MMEKLRRAGLFGWISENTQRGGGGRNFNLGLKLTSLNRKRLSVCSEISCQHKCGISCHFCRNVQLLKQHGKETPSPGFSLRLINVVTTSYKLSYSKKYRKQERLGKWIIGVLIACSLLVFIELKPSTQVLALVLPVFSFGIGLFILIFMLKKVEGKS